MYCLEKNEKVKIVKFTANFVCEILNTRLRHSRYLSEVSTSDIFDLSLEFSPVEEDKQRDELPSSYPSAAQPTSSQTRDVDEFESPLLKRRSERGGLTYEDLRRRNRVGNAPPSATSNSEEEESNVRKCFFLCFFVLEKINCTVFD